jgi:hypothetical protein
MALSHSPSIVTNGLVLCLDAANPKSYPGSGTTWTDLSGNGNNGTLVNGVGYSGDNLGSLVFDGVDDYISFPSSPTLTNQITVDAWVNLTATTPNGNGWILGREGSYRLTYASSSFQWVCSTVNNGWYTTGTPVGANLSTTGKIINVVGTYDGSNNRIYVNGTLAGINTNVISGNVRTNGTYYLVRSDAGNIDYGKLNMYSHKLYNKALTASEIQQNFNALRGRYEI